MKLGDEVVCIDSYNSSGLISLGDVYVVQATKGEDIWIRGKQRWWPKSRFVLKGQDKKMSINLVEEIELMKKVIELEGTLRERTQVEIANDIGNGPMRAAHEVAVNDIIATARMIVAKADGTS